MKRFAIALAVVVAAVVLYQIKYPTYTYRYRMTVNVEVDGQVRSGSSVIEVKVSKQPVFLPEMRSLEQSVLGDAVLVEIWGNNNIVALLTSGAFGQDVDFLSRIVPAHFKLNLSDDRSLAQLSSVHGSWELSQVEFPTFVSFEQPSDPKGGRLVKGGETVQISGRSVRVRGVTIEMTHDQVTRGIERKLVWLTNSGRPAVAALQAAGLKTAASIDAEFAFKRN